MLQIRNASRVFAFSIPLVLAALVACGGDSDGGGDGAGGGAVVGGGGNPEPTPIISKSWRTPTLIETDDVGAAVVPQIAIDPNGNALAIWSQSDGTRYNIVANRFIAGTGAGSGWGTAVLIETDNAGDAFAPQIAVDVNGNALAVWVQSDGTRNNIWANRFIAGMGWGAAELIETDNAGAAFSPQIALDGNGNALAVWPQSDGTHRNLVANRYTIGSGWGMTTLIETALGAVSAPAIGFDANGNALAVWTQHDGTRFNVWATQFAAGLGWGTAELIEIASAGNSTAPQVAVDANGNALAVWSKFDGTRDNIWANRFTVGMGWGAAALIETGSHNARDVQIARDNNGNALAIWSHLDGTRYNIMANRFIAGIGWGTPALVGTNNAAGASRPQIAFDAAGDALAVWQQFDGMRNNIWANRFTAGTGWGSAALIETNDDGDASAPRIAIDAHGNALVVWVTGINIWANRYE